MPDDPRWKRRTLLMFLAMLVGASLIMAALAALVVWIVV